MNLEKKMDKIRAQRWFQDQVAELSNYENYWLEMVETFSDVAVRVDQKTGKTEEEKHEYLLTSKAKEFIQTIFKVLQNVSKH